MIAVLALKEGEVVSYGDIAARAGRPDAPRAVGRVLSNSPIDLPWWRVVYSSGKIAECNLPAQQERLVEEGVTFKGQKIEQSPKGRFRRRRK